jgi:lactoylglutathione lyase
MITSIGSTGVYVNDQDEAIDFYVNKLGFELREDQPMGEGLRWIEVAPPGGDTVVVLTMGYGGWAPEKVGDFAGIAFLADDVRATHEELSGRGVEFTQEPTEEPWGTYASFKDQDGNEFVLVQRQ